MLISVWFHSTLKSSYVPNQCLLNFVIIIILLFIIHLEYCYLLFILNIAIHFHLEYCYSLYILNIAIYYSSWILLFIIYLEYLVTISIHFRGCTLKLNRILSSYVCEYVHVCTECSTIKENSDQSFQIKRVITFYFVIINDTFISCLAKTVI